MAVKQLTTSNLFRNVRNRLEEHVISCFSELCQCVFLTRASKKVHLKNISILYPNTFSPLISCPDFNSVFVFLLLFQLEVCSSPDGRGLLSLCTLICTHRDCHSTHTLGHNSFTHRMLCLSRAGHTALALAASASGSILRNRLAAITQSQVSWKRKSQSYFCIRKESPILRKKD